MPNFTLGGGYLGGFGPKQRKIVQIVNFFAPQGTPCPMLVKSVGFVRVIGLLKLLTWCDSAGTLGIYNQKTAMGHFPPNFRSPLAPKQWRRYTRPRQVK